MMGTMIGKCCWLTGAVALLWLVLVVPAYALAGASGVEGLSYAALLCLGPGWLVFLVLSRYGGSDSALSGVLLGMALRMIVVLFGVLIIRAVRVELGFREFLVWVVVFYSATLLVETLLLVRPSRVS